MKAFQWVSLNAFLVVVVLFFGLAHFVAFTENETLWQCFSLDFLERSPLHSQVASRRPSISSRFVDEISRKRWPSIDHSRVVVQSSSPGSLFCFSMNISTMYGVVLVSLLEILVDRFRRKRNRWPRSSMAGR